MRPAVYVAAPAQAAGKDVQPYHPYKADLFLPLHIGTSDHGDAHQFTPDSHQPPQSRSHSTCFTGPQPSLKRPYCKVESRSAFVGALFCRFVSYFRNRAWASAGARPNHSRAAAVSPAFTFASMTPIQFTASS